jgi:hypothetical protein
MNLLTIPIWNIFTAVKIYIVAFWVMTLGYNWKIKAASSSKNVFQVYTVIIVPRHKEAFH